ncbi:MAG: hypothetical protein NWE89_13600 [Candidatus Bathyarchaeota archaeon]|nr:hypothetical protein [Candidatus Bathyarchaeota archaeon]
MRKYSTISVPIEVKEMLKKKKGERNWGEYLFELFMVAERTKKDQAFNELIKLLDENDLRKIEESSKSFREDFIF